VILHITVQTARHSDIQAVKENLAMHCENYGDVRLIDVRIEKSVEPKQMKIGGIN